MWVQEDFCRKAVGQIVKELGKIDILVNNAAEQHPQESIEKITEKQLEHTFRTNIFSFFFMTKAAMKYLRKGGAIINTTSVTAYKGSAHLLDSSSTKGAITAFTRSLSQELADKRIRVKWRHAVRFGPVDPVYFLTRGGGDFWIRCSARPAWSTRRSRAKLCITCIRRFFIHDRPDFASKRRYIVNG